MPAILAQLIPLLTFLASTGGAGWAASVLFDLARRQLPRPTLADWRAAPLVDRLAYRLLYAPAPARLSVFVLAACISAACSAALAAATGQQVLPALDAALAVIVSQVVHVLGLPNQPRSR